MDGIALALAHATDSRLACSGGINRSALAAGGACLDLAACMVQAGVARKESRGAHARPYDYPTRDDDNFMKHSISRWNHEKNAPELSYQDVRVTKWEPMERKY